MELQLNVLENGLDFINKCLYELGDSIDHTSSIKYAVLHLNAGIELIFKARLTRDHWAFVFEDLNKAKYDNYIEGDFKSINLDTALYRLQHICNISISERFIRSIERLKKTRNRIEHFHIKENQYQLESIIYETLSYIIPFMNKEFPNIYSFRSFYQISSLLHKQEKYISERYKRIKNELTSNNFKVDCPQCNQDNTFDVDEEICIFCNYSGNVALNEFVKKYADLEGKEGTFTYKQYDILKFCPYCNEEKLIISSTEDLCKCLSCNEAFSKEKFLECENCKQVDILIGEDLGENGEVIHSGYYCYKCLFSDE
ncbi:hypothetical protein V2I71_01840 [Peribacillus frigoritolerans]|uniref:hypothetical protein n=1 Tax=Peribacillus frigoritolerans TaxID=450367 RepID=UPI002ED2DBA4|nr:hypothetical protein V2I71_01840 [Peribacillus frigoritolerans]